MAAGQETAIKHTFNPMNRRWSAANITVSMSPQPFQEGTMRLVFDLVDFSLPPGKQQCVAKISKDPCENRQTYFAEVEMQYKCKDLACKFNSHCPPKRIDFIDAWVLEFPNRPSPNGGRFTVMAEPKLQGNYTKHSNNFGFVSPEDRNTPQAFSHWTWVASSGRLLVCDIQGVGDMYTDPQIHSNAGPQNYLYGRGDMGMEGIQKFFGSHRCNGLCRFLGLPPTPNSAMFRHPFENGTAVRGRTTSPVNDLVGGRSSNYSPASLSPASSVGGISTGSGFGDHPLAFRPLPVGAELGLSFPQLPMPMMIAL